MLFQNIWVWPRRQYVVAFRFLGSSCRLPNQGFRIDQYLSPANLLTRELSFTQWTATREYHMKLKAIVDLNQQTRQLPDGSRVAAFLKGDQLKEYLYEDAKTLCEAVHRGCRVSNNGKMLGDRVKQPDGSRPYVWLSYQEVIDRSFDFAYGLSALGIKNGKDNLIGIYSRNCSKCIISELAAYNNSAAIVPIYDTLGKEARTYIIQLCEIELVVCDNGGKARALIESKPNCPTLKHVVLMEPFEPELAEEAKKEGIAIHAFEEVEKLGRSMSPKPTLRPPQPEDICTISFTSGTTGTPKGVMLTHKNVISCTTVFLHRINIRSDPSDVVISYLPLAHMYERLVHYISYQQGESVGFFSGDVRGLLDDMKTLRPTIVPLVPRVLNRFCDNVNAKVRKSFIKRILFNLAVAYKTYEMKRGIIRNDSIVDKLVLKKIRDEMGGRVKLMLTGSAPLAEEVLKFARAIMGCVIFEGYGQTECVAACTAAVEADFLAGHVGIPSLCNAVKLVDVPELGYFAHKNEGEVCVKGHNVFKGYYKNEEKTKEAIDEDGWLHTGDIGRWNKNGTLSIVNRKKQIFKLQQGEYVAPEKVENVYTQSKYVAQAFIHGESLKNSLVAIIVPDQEVLEHATQGKPSLKNLSYEELCANPTVKKMIFNDMIALGKQAGLSSFEQAKDIFISPEHFTVENGLLTPTMKARRTEIQSYFSPQIADMYSKLD